MVSPMILNLNQMWSHIMENLSLFHAYINSRSKRTQSTRDLKLINKVNRSQLGAPTFLIPKKDSTVRFISDFRELNKRILRQPYPIPKIQDLLLRLEGFRYGTTLDLNMGYYHMNSRSNKNSIDSSIGHKEI